MRKSSVVFIAFLLTFFVQLQGFAQTNCGYVANGGSRCGAGSVYLYIDNTSGGMELGHDYQWYNSSFQALPGATSWNYSPSVSTTTTFYAKVTSNGMGTECQTDFMPATAYIESASFSTIDANVCGSGGTAVIRVANPGGNDVYDWYYTQTGGTAIPKGEIQADGVSVSANGDKLYVAGLNQNETFWVEKVSGTCTSTGRIAGRAYVRPIPSVTIDANANPTTVCKNDGAFTLSGGLPSGGSWQIDGQSGNTFNPAILSKGEHTIRYTYINSYGCFNSAERTITINDFNISASHEPENTCQNTEAVILSASPAGGSWSGSAFIAQTPEGYYFRSKDAGPGSHTVTYTASSNGCSKSTTTTISIGEYLGATYPDAPAIKPVSPKCGPATFRIEYDDGQASGEPPMITTTEFQWYHGDTPLIGEVFPVLNTPVLTSSDNQYNLRIYEDGCESYPRYVNLIVRDAPVASASDEERCGTGDITFTASSATADSFNWYANETDTDPLNFTFDNAYTISGGKNQFFTLHNVQADNNVIHSYWVEPANTICTGGRIEIEGRAFEIPPQPNLSVAGSPFQCGSGSFTLQSDIMVAWYGANPETNPSTPILEIGLNYQTPTLTSAKAYFARKLSGQCDGPVAPILVNIVALPEVPSPTVLNFCIGDEVVLSTNAIPAGGTATWFDPENIQISTEPSPNIGQLPFGDNDYQVLITNVQGCESEARGIVTVSVGDEGCDDNLNWTYAEQYDEYRNPIAATKRYFGYDGKLLQVQSKNYTIDKIFAQTAINDQYGRPVLSSLSAPLNRNNFNYKHDFFAKAESEKYDYLAIDAGTPVYSGEPGSLGWYYSANNTWEENVPVTAYPYSRKQFYTDGSGEVKKAGAPGEVLRIGGGHVSKSGTYSATNELEEYFTIREALFPGYTTSATHLANEAVVAVGQDRNGRYGFTVTDRGERVLMSASHGATETLPQTKSNELADGTLSNFIYFYLTSNSSITYTGTTAFTIENMMNDDPMGQPSSLAPGFYRAVVTSGELTISYQVKFGDASYNYYDNAGRLICSISPNGIVQYRAGVALDKIDRTTYTYNHQGWLLSTTEPDAGKTEYMYRTDGSIRFSQNSQQKEKGKFGTFSFTNYDPLGRPVMSGEYEPNQNGQRYISFKSSESYAILDDVSTTAGLFDPPPPPGAQPIIDLGYVLHDWVKTFYDEPAASIPNLPNSYEQDFVMGAVSYTQNSHITTWYSYDEQGRVTWMAQKPNALDRTFLMEYEYDFLGNVLKVAFRAYDANSVREQFYHYYTYDADKRLSNAYTSTEDILVSEVGTSEELQLQAHYEYYLHGPLKRVELGGNMQGIDFVYDISGWLKSINNPDDLSDEAGFMEDAFGMLLNYYNNDMSSLFSIATLDPSPNPNLFHHMPEDWINNRTNIAQLMDMYRPFVNEVNVNNSLKKHSAELPFYIEQLKQLKSDADASKGQ